MRAGREVTLSVICALLVACSAASAPDTSHDPSVQGVGVLPDSNPVEEGPVATGAETIPPSGPTTTALTPLETIGTLVSGNRLLMIGDSITASAAKRYGGELCNALVPLGWQVEIDAEPSRFVDFGNAVLDKRLSAKWDAAYVFLGSNYMGDQLAYRKQLERIVQRLSPRPVVLLTITLFEDSRQEVNDAVMLVSAEFPNVHVLDWGSIAAADAPTILRGDGLHLTNAGRAVLASTVASVMGHAPAEPGQCLSTSFTNDSGLSVNGTDIPPKRPVTRPTPPTTLKPQAPTTVGNGAAPTTKPPSTVPPPTQTPPTQPPPTQPPPTVAPTVPPVTVPPSTVDRRRPPTPPPAT